MEVADGDLQTGCVGQRLQLDLPQAVVSAVTAPTVRRDEQAGGLRIGLLAHALPPGPEGGDGKGGGVVIGADANPGLVARGVVHAVRGDLAELGVDEVVHLDRFGLPLGLPFPAAVFIGADEILLFVSKETTGWPCC